MSGCVHHRLTFASLISGFTLRDLRVAFGEMRCLLPGWCDENIPISYVPFFTTLKVDRPGHFFVAVQRATCDSRNLLIVDDCLTILNRGDPPPDQRDIEALPFSRLASHFRGRCQETVHSARMVTGRFLDGLGFNLDLVTPA